MIAALALNGNSEICLTWRPSLRSITELLFKLPSSRAVKKKKKEKKELMLPGPCEFIFSPWEAEYMLC